MGSDVCFHSCFSLSVQREEGNEAFYNVLRHCGIDRRNNFSFFVLFTLVVARAVGLVSRVLGEKRSQVFLGDKDKNVNCNFCM